MTYLLDQDQDQRQEQYAAIEEIYLLGIGDAAAGLFPQQAELTYLQGYAKGMVDYPRREVKLLVFNAESKEFPLLCSQCSFFSHGKCELKKTVRDSNSFACDHVVINCPF